MVNSFPSSAIESAFLAFLAAVRADPALPDVSWTHLDGHPAWDELRRQVAAHVPRDSRPDLYGQTGLHAGVLLRTSGLARVIKDTTLSGDTSHDQALAADFARLCTRPVPDSEDWVLLDAQLPSGSRIPLGRYVLEVPSRDDLVAVQPIPTACALYDEEVPLPPGHLGDAAFLRLPMPDRALVQGRRLPATLGSKIELVHWLPLLALNLWSADITQAEAVYEVEAGRRVERADGMPTYDSQTYETELGGAEDYLVHDRDGCSVTSDDVPAFTAFAGEVVDRISRLVAPDGPNLTKNQRKKPHVKLARRLRRAGQHLVRGVHRTWPFGHVSEYEQEEVLLHYVIAMEALLADEDNLDLSRKVKFRAATLFGSDAERARVADLVGRAYNARSRYVHGDDIEDDLDLDDLRQLTRQVVLRWLILATSGPDGSVVADGKTITDLLDSAVLSDAVRRRQVLKPLTAFFDTTPADSYPKDLLPAPAEEEASEPAESGRT